MKTKIATAPTARWRDRFLEIARQAEGSAAHAPRRPIAGLRLRARVAHRRVWLLASLSGLQRGQAR
jgi:hypothetical protein